MRNIFIYALCEPGTRTVRYIGKSVHPKKRLTQHLRESIKTKTHLGNWLRSLLGIPPALVILSEVPEADGSAEEIKYIAAARTSLGMELTNSTDGGEGVTQTLEVRAKISAAQKGVPKSPEQCATQSAAHMGVPKSPEQCAAQSVRLKGVPRKPFSLEWRAAMSAAHKGVPLSPERCAAIGAAHKKLWADPKYRAAMSGPKSPEHCAAMKVPKPPEFCAARSAAQKKLWADPEYRAAMIAARKKNLTTTTT